MAKQMGGADGWPTINEGKGPSSRAEGPAGRHERKRELTHDEDFKSATLAPGWNSKSAEQKARDAADLQAISI